MVTAADLQPYSFDLSRSAGVSMYALAPFLTGLGLFFCGVNFLSAHLVPLAGRRLRLLVTKVGARPWLAALFGSFAGVLTQSVNAVTAVAIGLVGSGLVDKRRAILIPTWSNVGTSLLVILVSIDLRVAAAYFVALAGTANYFGLDRTERARHALGTILALGLLFIGMHTLKVGAQPLVDMMMQDGYLARAAGHPLVLLLIGIGISVGCQSSPVAGALAATGAGAGILDLSAAAWIVYGANIGSAGNFALLARTQRGVAAQITLMQSVQKLAGFAVVAVLLIAGAVSHVPLIENALGTLSRVPAAQIAWLFLIYQIAGAALCTVLLERILPLLAWLAPPSPLQELSRPAFLIEDALIDSVMALDLVAREENRLLQRLPAMLDGVRADVEHPAVEHKMLRTASLSVANAMTGYLGSIIEAKLDRPEREQAVRLHHRTANLAALFDALDEFVAACIRARESPAGGRVADQMIESLHTLLTSLAEATASKDASEREVTLALLGHRDELMERIRQRVLREDPDMPPRAQEALFAATMLFERIVWLARRNALLLTPESPATASAEQFAIAS
jgi:phosphate:Na+ symporter